MGIIFWILELFSGVVLERILDKLLEDKSGNIHDAFEKAYNSWKVNHISSIIQKKDYDRLKPRFIASLCQKESFQFEEEEESLFQEWLAQIEKCENVSDELQRETIQKLFSELQEMSLNQIQLNDDLLSKITTLIEQVVFNTNQKEAILEKDLVDIKQLICDYGLRTALTEQTFPEVDGYIERYVTSEKDKNNFARFILHQAPQTLYDKICSAKIGKNKFLLIDKGQSGKTTELKEIAYKLAKSGRYFPILIKSYDNPRLAKKDLPSGDIFNNKPIVILIDAADEFAQEERYCFFNIISDYAKEHPLSTIVISCRNNYDEVNSLKDFQALAFEDLTTDQWKSMIKTLANDKADGLIQHIIDRGLQEYMATPFEVSVITNYYLSTGRLLTSRAEIYKQFIESKLKRDEVKLHPDSKQLKYNSLPYLERIAVVMQSYGNDYILTYPEVQKCIDGKEDKIELIKRSNLIIPLEGDRYKFSENAYREYLAAAYISRLSVDKIFSFIKYRDIDSIRQQWVNVVIILLPILNKEYKDKFDILLKWLVAHDPEIVLFIDRTIVDKDTRENVFHNLLSHYHKQKRLIAPVNPQMSKKIMEFAQSAETLKFLFDEVKKNKDNDIIYLENLYSFIEFAQFSDLFLCGEQKLIDEFTDIVFGLIAKHVEDTDDKTFILYFPLRNRYYLESETYINRLIKTVGDSHNRYAVEAVMTMICFTEKYDKYAEYVLAHEEDLHDYVDKDGVTVGVFRFYVDKALGSVTSKDNILKVLLHISSKKFLLRNDYQDEDTLDIVRKLLGTAEANKIFEDDINSYKTLLRVYDSFMENGPFSKKGELSTEFKKFFESCPYGYQLFCEIIIELRKALKSGTYGQYMMNLYIVSLFLSEKNIDKLMDSMNASNDDDYALAESIFNIHDKNIEDYLTKKLDDKFGHHPVRPDGELKQKSSIQQLFDYDKFRNVVLDVISHHPQTHKDLNDYHSQPRIHTDNYVCSFFYMTSGEPYDLQKISFCINNKEYYYSFLLSMTLRNSGDKKFQDLMPEPVRQKLLCTAEDEIIKSDLKHYPTKATMALLIEEKLHLHYEQVEKLLPISYCRKGEKTLFEYISSLAECEGKKRQLLEYIEAHINYYQKNEDIYVLWACFMINNDQVLLFPSIFDWMQNCDNQWCHLQLLEAFWAKGEGKKLVEYRFSCLTEDDKISILRIIEKSKDSDDESWITSQLDDWQKYKDYNKKAVIRFLLYRGEMSVLKYIIQNFNLEYLKMDYSYNYSNPDATDWILFLFQKLLENSQITINCYNSLKQSLVNILLKDKNKRKQILDKLEGYASYNRGWLYNEIDGIKETLYKSDDEKMSFNDVLKNVPLREEYV